MKTPKECTSKEEIRDSIDKIDKDIISLLSKRFEYVKEIVKYKEATVDAIIAKKRYDDVLNKRAEWANKNGLSGEVIKSIYKQLLDYFIAEELKTINNKTN